YNEPMTPDQALIELTMRSGTYFDPDVIDAFVQYFSREIEPRSRGIENKTQPEPQPDSGEQVLEEAGKEN
ncbi:MAG TPA: hypothetical protein VNS63_13635, partial [Blastocatellia bacterium]|nr:hypothetical protein [Blastocatellia bacterium]